MSTLAELLAKAAPTTTQTNEKQEAFLWLNVGATLVIEGKPTFISLPLGIPLDTMKEAKGTGAYAQAKNTLLASILEMSNSVNSGDSKVITGLEVQMYRRGDKVEAAPTTAFNLSFK